MVLKKENFLKREDTSSIIRNINNFYIICGKCGEKALPIPCTCLCDLDWCRGQRCGASEKINYFKCLKCGWISEQTEEGKSYEEFRSKR